MQEIYNLMTQDIDEHSSTYKMNMLPNERLIRRFLRLNTFP